MNAIRLAARRRRRADRAAAAGARPADAAAADHPPPAPAVDPPAADPPLVEPGAPPPVADPPPGAAALGRVHARRLREVHRSAGWPCCDAIEVDLLAAGLLERVRSAHGHETLRVTDAGIAHIASSAGRQPRGAVARTKRWSSRSRAR